MPAVGRRVATPEGVGSHSSSRRCSSPAKRSSRAAGVSLPHRTVSGISRAARCLRTPTRHATPEESRKDSCSTWSTSRATPLLAASSTAARSTAVVVTSSSPLTATTVCDPSIVVTTASPGEVDAFTRAPRPPRPSRCRRQDRTSGRSLTRTGAFGRVCYSCWARKKTVLPNAAGAERGCRRSAASNVPPSSWNMQTARQSKIAYWQRGAHHPYGQSCGSPVTA